MKKCEYYIYFYINMTRSEVSRANCIATDIYLDIKYLNGECSLELEDSPGPLRRLVSLRVPPSLGLDS